MSWKRAMKHFFFFFKEEGNSSEGCVISALERSLITFNYVEM